MHRFNSSVLFSVSIQLITSLAEKFLNMAIGNNNINKENDTTTMMSIHNKKNKPSTSSVFLFVMTFSLTASVMFAAAATQITISEVCFSSYYVVEALLFLSLAIYAFSKICYHPSSPCGRDLLVDNDSSSSSSSHRRRNNMETNNPVTANNNNSSTINKCGWDYYNNNYNDAAQGDKLMMILHYHAK